MASFGAFDTILLHQFIRRLVKPFNKWKAFKTGVIDKDGNILLAKKDRTPAQDRSFQMYDLLVLNLKKLLGKIPGGKSRLASYATAIMLMREGVALDPDDDDILWEKMQGYFAEAEEFLKEDAPTNCAGDGSMVAGLDDNPARNMKKKKKNNVIVDPLLRRKKP